MEDHTVIDVRMAALLSRLHDAHDLEAMLEEYTLSECRALWAAFELETADEHDRTRQIRCALERRIEDWEEYDGE